MRTPLLAVVLLVSGCKLFASGAIDQTCEDMERGCPGDPQPDSGIDSGDSAPFVVENPYSLGFTVGMQTGETYLVQALSAAGDVFYDQGIEPPPGSEAGPVAYDPSINTLYYFDLGLGGMGVFSETLGDLQVIGVPQDSDESFMYARDLLAADGNLYLATDGWVYSYVPVAKAGFQVMASSTLLQRGRSLYHGQSDLYLLDIGPDGGQPDIFRVDSASGSLTLSVQDFDDGQGRAISAIFGPDLNDNGIEDDTVVCSALGAVYAVSSLQTGDREPYAFPNQDQLSDLLGIDLLEDVSSCAWDSAAERFLLFSATQGVLSLDSWGNLESLWQPSGEELAFAGDFFTLPE